MRKFFALLILFTAVFALVACGNDETEEVDSSEELKELTVEFDPEPTAEVGDTVELVATVTYGDEPVTDADEMEFEYWIGDGEEDADERDGEFLVSKNNEDGTYSVELTVDEAGQYWIYAHTTARDLHTMPKRSINVEE